MQLNFDVFDHQMKVKVAEIFWGAPAPPDSPSWGASPPQPPNPISVAPKKNIVALNQLERLRDLPLHSQYNRATSRSKTWKPPKMVGLGGRDVSIINYMSKFHLETSPVSI